MPDFQLPRSDSRTTVIGGTGSGKTQFSSWLLSRADIDTRPWLAIDYKRDRIFERLIRENVAPLVGVGHRFRRGDKGLVIMRPTFDQNEQIDDVFRHIWRRGRTGLWIDELYSVPNGDALNALYYQGRSKGIQIIASCQRPVDVTRFAISEADNFAIFTLRDQDDYRRVRGFVPSTALAENRPRYHCLWYDAARNAQFMLTPAPPAEDTISAIEARQPYRYW